MFVTLGGDGLARTVFIFSGMIRVMTVLPVEEQKRPPDGILYLMAQCVGFGDIRFIQ